MVHYHPRLIISALLFPIIFSSVVQTCVIQSLYFKDKSGYLNMNKKYMKPKVQVEFSSFNKVEIKRLIFLHSFKDLPLHLVTIV